MRLPRRWYTIFQLTASQGGRQGSGEVAGVLSPFNSRPHKEADLIGHIVFHQESPFNSRPHEEADILRIDSRSVSHLSTHGLTRRPT